MLLRARRTSPTNPMWRHKMRNAALLNTTAALLTRESGIELTRRDAIPRPRTFDADAQHRRGGDRHARRRSRAGMRAASFWKSSIPLASTFDARAAHPFSTAISRAASINVFGTIDDAWLEGNEVIARIRFSTRPEIARRGRGRAQRHHPQPLGRLRGRASGATAATPAAERTRTAARWSIREVSFVSVPADPTARTGARGSEATAPPSTAASAI